MTRMIALVDSVTRLPPQLTVDALRIAIGGGGYTFTQATAASQWHFTHSLARRPAVTVYDATGNLILADVAATSTDVTITLANAATGSVVLT